MVIVGGGIGLLAALLQKSGNPPNMGICVACFERDIAGALGLHRFAAAQFIRPEIIGFVLGALLGAFVFREFRPRAGSAPIARFFLGVFAMIGALVFLGCSWRALLRLAGGDANAVVGLVGMTAGIGIGVYFRRCGYGLGRARPMPASIGLIMPIAMIALLLLLVFRVSFGADKAVFFSRAGLGALHAPIWLSLGVGLLIGFLAQRTRFCTIGAFSDAVLVGEFRQLIGVAALVVGALVANLIFGQFKVGFVAQPIAHSNHLWNFLGMALAGLAFALAGGCPGRQLFLSGEGDGDAAVFVWGMIVAGAFVHNMALGGMPDKMVEGAAVVGGPALYGKIAVVLGLVYCLALGGTARVKS